MRTKWVPLNVSIPDLGRRGNGAHNTHKPRRRPPTPPLVHSPPVTFDFQQLKYDAFNDHKPKKQFTPVVLPPPEESTMEGARIASACASFALREESLQICKHCKGYIQKQLFFNDSYCSERCSEDAKSLVYYRSLLYYAELTRYYEKLANYSEDQMS